MDIWVIQKGNDLYFCYLCTYHYNDLNKGKFFFDKIVYQKFILESNDAFIVSLKLCIKFIFLGFHHFIYMLVHCVLPVFFNYSFHLSLNLIHF